MSFEQDQKDFIKTKVKELGSVQATKELYNQDCEVDKYANIYASKLYNKGEKFSSDNK